MRLRSSYSAHGPAGRLAFGSTLVFGTLLFAVMLWGVGCKKNEAPAPAPAAANQPQTQPQTEGQPQASAMSLDELVAPIALYPDKLLGQLLIVATNPQEVLDLGNWLIMNQSMKPADAPAAAKAAGFSTSAQYLAAFPQVVDNMCQQMDWTKDLGEAVKSNQQGVLNAIQAKRLQAQQQGNLKSSPQMTVDTATDNGKQVVEIKPADPQVIYVPQYNPETVYTEPAPAQTTQTTQTNQVNQTVVVEQQEQSGVSTGGAVAIGLLSFGVGMAVGSAFHNDDYYPYPGWGGGGMYYGGRPYYPPPYAAPHYAGYRPAGAYAPPGNYRWSNYNRNVNLNVNNNNYYNRYNANRVNPNNRAGNNGYLGNNNRPGGGNSGYLGARNDVGRNNGPPGASMARVNPGINNNGRGIDNNNRGVDNNRGNNNRGVNNNNRGVDNNNRGMNGNAGRGAAGNPSARPGGGADRGYGNNSPGNNARANNMQAQNRGASQGALGGANANGRAATQDSSRGRQSMNAPSGGGRPPQGGGGQRAQGGGGGGRPPQGGGGGGGGRSAPSGGGKRR